MNSTTPWVVPSDAGHSCTASGRNPSLRGPSVYGEPTASGVCTALPSPNCKCNSSPRFAATVTGNKFMAGEPMKLATNSVAGCE